MSDELSRGVRHGHGEARRPSDDAMAGGEARPTGPTALGPIVSPRLLALSRAMAEYAIAEIVAGGLMDERAAAARYGAIVGQMIGDAAEQQRGKRVAAEQEKEKAKARKHRAAKAKAR